MAAGSKPHAGTAALLRWGAANRRDLPWRRVRDPWAVLVSEVMLQQTQVARVRDRWRVFLDRFPDPGACAAASQASVVALWDGLGYPRRARDLHRTAQLVTAVHGGRVPADLDALLALPGVGAYTARAVLAFAFEQDVGVVDTNTGRVLARWAGHPLGPAEAQRRADLAVPAGQGWAWNQAMFDLAASVCSRRDPGCGDCPVRATCAWRGHGSDPASRSAGVSRPQRAYQGSDRQGRGRLVRALAAAPVPAWAVAAVMGWPGDPARAERVAATLVADGLVARRGELFVLAER